MKEIGKAISEFSAAEIAVFEKNETHTIDINGEKVVLEQSDVEIISEDIPGWQVANEGRLTVALDVTVTEELRNEGIAREFVNRIQNIRKEAGFDVTDKIIVKIGDHDFIREAVKRHAGYIGSQTLAAEVTLVESLDSQNTKEVDIDEVMVKISVERKA
jgi:isoleucyl-tRNA synthetase